VSFRTARTTQRNPVSKNPKGKKKMKRVLIPLYIFERMKIKFTYRVGAIVSKRW
jgi:hypothetical protein